ncbi:MAG: hypothetical protein FJ319_12685 [SAR202 cluster bacterium]|nr:hypothetical protein [SAR202 cluster bacterium]
MPKARKPSLTPEEARQLHYEALVIDAQQPPTTYGFLYNDNMRANMKECLAQGLSRGETSRIMSAMIASEVQHNPKAREEYINFWRRSGVTVASGTYGDTGPFETQFEDSVRRIAQARGIIDSLGGEMVLVRKAADIERAHRTGNHGLIIDFQDTVPFGSDLDRVEVFFNMGLRVVQLTYNLRNLVGDGCAEIHKSGVTRFGKAMIERLNSLKMVVDVSHSCEQVGWDAMDISTSPVVVTHANPSALVMHDRAKSDKFAKAIADQGGFFGVTIIPGYLQEGFEATLDHFVDHVEHLVNVMGIDHVGIGNDKCGPGPSTDSMIEFPKEMRGARPGAFNWAGFRPEHRVDGEYHIVGYENFADWPNLTIALARRGFNEEELRKLLGLNYLRVFRDIVG